MNVINIEHISKIYGEKKIFDDISLGIQQDDKIGIIGINGTGKSTLLRIIAGEEVPDTGEVVRQNSLKSCGCLRVLSFLRLGRWHPML